MLTTLDGCSLTDWYALQAESSREPPKAVFKLSIRSASWISDWDNK